jgi:hypothetical protein
MSDVVKLVRVSASTSVYIDAKVSDEGNLVISGQDLGSAPDEIFGDSDYEYWLTVPAAEKDKLLLALLETHYSGDAMVVSTLRKVMESKRIRFNFHSS